MIEAFITFFCLIPDAAEASGVNDTTAAGILLLGGMVAAGAVFLRSGNPKDAGGVGALFVVLAIAVLLC